MRKIGGSFDIECTLEQDNGYFGALCPPDGGLRFMMSGRCGIYYCLEDIQAADQKRVAYVPR